jgi:Fe(3+) dicitrate transport protein
MRAAGVDVQTPGDSAVTGVIPGIGMIVGSKNAHVFAGLHEGWAPPRVTASISPKGVPAQVSAEQSLTYELGTRVRHAKWLRGEATAYLSNFSNQVVLNTAPGAAATAETDAGTTRHYGLEVGTVLELARALHVDAVVDVAARYAFSRALFVGGPYDGNELPYAPLHALNGNADLELRSGFGAQIAYSFVGSQYTDVANTVAADASGRVGLMPSHHVLDATAHYRHKKSGLTFRATVKNALDDIYISARRPEGIFTAGYRQILVGVRWDYEAPSAPP